MKKWMILVAVAVAAVVAVGVYFFVAQESHDYCGSSYSADCTMNITNDSFKLTFTEYTDNDHLSVRYTYSGNRNADRFTVESLRTEYCEFGKVYKETSETGLSLPLSEMIFFREVNGGYLVKDTFIKNKSNDVSPALLYVTTEEALNEAGCDITLLKGSSRSDIKDMTVVEVYGDGSVYKYPVDKGNIGDADFDTIGTKKITVGYGDGRFANLTLEIVPFKVEKSEIMSRGTSFEYAKVSGKIVIDKAYGTGEISAEGWDSSDGTRCVQLNCGDYSVSLPVTFTSDSDRTVRYLSTGIEHFIKSGTELPVFSIRMELNNGTVYDIQSDDEQLTLSGYSKDAVGPQAIRADYMGSRSDFIMYSYDDSNMIPKEAHLINVNKLYDSKDSLLLYTEKGVDYGNYAIRYVMCDGSVRTMPLTQDMVTYDEEIDLGKRYATTAEIKENIETYRYSEKVDVKYDLTEEKIKSSLTYSNIIGDRTSANYRMDTDAGTYNISFGYRSIYEFYVAHDNVTSSSYLSSNVRYTHADSESFTLYLSKGHSMDMERSILYGSELERYYIDHDDVKYAEFSMKMTAEDVDFFSGFGFSVGDTITLKVTYDGQSAMTAAMDIIKDGTTLATGTFAYGNGVSLSDEVNAYVNNLGTVSVMMEFGDGRDDHSYHVNAGTVDLTFQCDEGYGVYLKVGSEYVPFEMPPIGITTSVKTYYLASKYV